MSAGPPARPATVLAALFLLELAVFGALGYWGWHLGDGGARGAAFAVLLPVLAAATWGIFRVPGEAGRSGRPPVTVPGIIRLLIELTLIGLAAFGLWTSGSRAAAETLLTAAVILYAVSWERLAWLLRQ